MRRLWKGLLAAFSAVLGILGWILDQFGRAQTLRDLPILSIVVNSRFPPIAFTIGVILGGWVYYDIQIRKQPAGFMRDDRKRKKIARRAVISVFGILLILVGLPLAYGHFRHKTPALALAPNSQTSTQGSTSISKPDVQQPSPPTAKKRLVKKTHAPLGSPAQTPEPTGSNWTPAPNTGIVIDNSSDVTFENSELSGYSPAVIMRGGSHDLHFDNFTATNAPSGLLTSWKQRVFDDAGSPEKIKEDFQSLKEQMEPIWATRPDLQKAAEAQFQSVEDVFMSKASDKEEVRKLLEGLHASPADKPPQ